MGGIRGMMKVIVWLVAVLHGWPGRLLTLWQQSDRNSDQQHARKLPCRCFQHSLFEKSSSCSLPTLCCVDQTKQLVKPPPGDATKAAQETEPCGYNEWQVQAHVAA